MKHKHNPFVLVYGQFFWSGSKIIFVTIGLIHKSPRVSRLGFTRWVPGSCWSLPQMASADWTIPAFVKAGSPICYWWCEGWVHKAVKVGSLKHIFLNWVTVSLDQARAFFILPQCGPFIFHYDWQGYYPSRHVNWLNPMDFLLNERWWYLFNPGVDKFPKMEHKFGIHSDSWLCWVKVADRARLWVQIFLRFCI